MSSFRSTGGIVKGLNARGCPSLKVLNGAIEVLDISGSAIDLGDPGFDCSRIGSQILFAQNLRKKMTPETVLDMIANRCFWTPQRKLLDLTGAWKGELNRDGLQKALGTYMTMFDTGPTKSQPSLRNLVLGIASVQCMQSPVIISDYDIQNFPVGVVRIGQKYALMQFQCDCAANNEYDGSKGTCKPLDTPYMQTRLGQASVAVIVTLVISLFGVIRWRLIRRRFSRLKFSLDVTERLLGEAQSDVVALRKAWEILDNDIHLVTRIDGSSPGAFGEVWRGDWDGIAVAVKVLRLSMMELDESTQDEFDKEAEFLMRARHSNVVYFFGAGVLVNGAPFLVLELVARGSLRGLLREDEVDSTPMDAIERKHPLSRTVQLRLALDVARGMEYIHSLGTLHRDLKSGNVLVTASWRGKVADFGSMGSILVRQERGGYEVGPSSDTTSTRFGDDHSNAPNEAHLTLTRGIGTPLYMSPEVLRGEKYGQAADVWR